MTKQGVTLLLTVAALSAPAGKASQVKQPTNPSELRMYHAQLAAQNPNSHHALAHEAIRLTGPYLDELCIKYPDFFNFLIDFTNDKDWLETYMTQLNVPRSREGIRALYEIYKAHGKDPDFNKYKPLACAVASAWGYGQGTNGERPGQPLSTGLLVTLERQGKTTPVSRFALIQRLHKEGKMQPVYDTLDGWLLEYIAGYNWGDEEFLWQNENIRLPQASYAQVHWCGEYMYSNKLGTSVFTYGEFYQPWSDKFNYAQGIRHTKGVCGAVSTVAAMAAAAHGIPAHTLSQPAHCAYTVRLDGNWVGGYGGPEGPPHHPSWGRDIPAQRFAHTLLADEVHSNKLEYLQSIKNLATAHTYAYTLFSPTQAHEYFSKALEDRRNYRALWDYAHYLKQHPTQEGWQLVADIITENAARSDPQALVYVDFLTYLMNNNLLPEALATQCISTITPTFAQRTTTWDWNPTLTLDVWSKVPNPTIQNFVLEQALTDSASSSTLKWAFDKFLKQQYTEADFEAIFKKYISDQLKSNKPHERTQAYSHLRELVAKAWSHIADQEHANQIAVNWYLKLRNLSLQYNNQYNAALMKYDPLALGRPAGAIVSGQGYLAPAKSVDTTLRQRTNGEDVGYLVSAMPQPAPHPRNNTSQDTTVNAQLATQYIWTVHLPQVQTATGCLVVVPKNQKSALRLLTASGDGSYTAVAQGVTDSNGRWVVEFPPRQVKSYRLELVGDTPGSKNLSVFTLFNKNL